MQDWREGEGRSVWGGEEDGEGCRQLHGISEMHYCSWQVQMARNSKKPPAEVSTAQDCNFLEIQKPFSLCVVSGYLLTARPEYWIRLIVSGSV